MKRFIGFTLAEVLITLAIVGVVAALTLPAFIQNYQKHVLVNQLKKSYSMWSQAFEKMLADDGVEKLSDTDVFSSFLNEGISGSTFYFACEHDDFSACPDLFSDLQKYIKIEIPTAKEKMNIKEV